jgi:hypothetical protein
VLATLFFLNCLALAGFSLGQSKSLMHNFTPRASAAANMNVTTTNTTVTTAAAVNATVADVAVVAPVAEKKAETVVEPPANNTQSGN